VVPIWWRAPGGEGAQPGLSVLSNWPVAEVLDQETVGDPRQFEDLASLYVLPIPTMRL